VVSVRNIPNEDLDECLCTAQHSTRDYIHVDDDGMEQADAWVHNPLYTLSNEDRETISQPNGWLRDSVINASQLLLLQDHPNIAVSNLHHCRSSELSRLTQTNSSRSLMWRMRTGVWFPILAAKMVL
jgi:hypothetical protein